MSVMCESRKSQNPVADLEKKQNSLSPGKTKLRVTQLGKSSIQKMAVKN